MPTLGENHWDEGRPWSWDFRWICMIWERFLLIDPILDEPETLLNLWSLKKSSISWPLPWWAFKVKRTRSWDLDRPLMYGRESKVYPCLGRTFEAKAELDLETLGKSLRSQRNFCKLTLALGKPLRRKESFTPRAFGELLRYRRDFCTSTTTLDEPLRQRENLILRLWQISKVRRGWLLNHETWRPLMSRENWRSLISWFGWTSGVKEKDKNSNLRYG